MKDYIGIYIHSPFCGSKCGYCSFYSFPGTKDEITLYAQRLEQDILNGIVSLVDDYENATIYLGGGTPSSFPASTLSDLIRKVTAALVDRSIFVQEITVEVNPADYSLYDLSLLQESGVNRLSIGIQSLSDADLSLMGRRHSVTDVFNIVEFAKQAGFSGISGDLIYGLPGQNFNQWKEGLERLFQLGLNHISLYELTLEEGTPFFEKRIVEEDEERTLEFLDFMLTFLQRNAFERYEISNYSKGQEYRSLHNFNYWRQKDYLGFGPSAVSTIGNIRTTIKPSLKDYLAGNTQCEIHELSQKDCSFERIMLGLRSCEGIKREVIETYQETYLSKDERSFAMKALKEFIDCKYFMESSGRLSFTNKGFLLYNEVLGKIL